MILSSARCSVTGQVSRRDGRCLDPCPRRAGSPNASCPHTRHPRSRLPAANPQEGECQSSHSHVALPSNRDSILNRRPNSKSGLHQAGHTWSTSPDHAWLNASGYGQSFLSLTLQCPLGLRLRRSGWPGCARGSFLASSLGAIILSYWTLLVVLGRSHVSLPYKTG